ncbi:MAG: glycosyltransferase [Verrucomicrobia bacterium]|nr:glycosyltransferase [Verrucomicrobiota bacterium]
MPKISVIVPAFNEEKLIAQSLRATQDALSEFSRAGFDTELVVCDNNSTDRTAELARAAGARVVFEPVNQIARARNTGAQAATGEWLIFVDADSFPSAELFRAAVTAMRRPDCLAGGAPVRLDERCWWADCYAALWNFVSRLKRWPAGSFIFCETAAFRELGGFSEKLFASEEIELFLRVNRLARQRGRRVVMLRTPLVTSARKTQIYSRAELFRFLARALLRPRATMHERERCGLWYDGRR